MMKKLLLASLLLVINVCAFAQGDEKAVAVAVEKFRVALIDANEAELSRLTSPSLTYGHSNGLMEDKKAFIEALVSGTANFEKIDLSEQSIILSGDVAVVRHKLEGETHNKGKDIAPIKISVILIWQKTKGNWLLLARQAFRLP